MYRWTVVLAVLAVASLSQQAVAESVITGKVMDTEGAPVSQAPIQQVMDRLNHRPRKALRFRSPYEVWCQETGTIP